MLIDGREVSITHPDKVVFPAVGLTKGQIVDYYLAVADGVLRGVLDRPMILKRFVKGISEEAFFQKRAPTKRPDWVSTARLTYARGTFADEVVITQAATLAWVINLGCVDLNPHPVRADDLDHPDELRIDLDPMPGVEWPQVVEIAAVVREVLTDHGLTSWPKTSGSRGFHIYAAITPDWTFAEVRRAAQTVAREVELRRPDTASATWWKEERGVRVFVDFNQNAKDRTVASAYSIRATPTATVSAPLHWDEVAEVVPDMFTPRLMSQRFEALGDPWAGMTATAGSLESLLARAKELGPPPKRSAGSDDAGRRLPRMPLIEIARAKTKPEALAGLDRWRIRHPEAAARLEDGDVLVDGMRGRSSIWYRIRVNLQHVPDDQRPAQEALDVDYNPWEGVTW